MPLLIAFILIPALEIAVFIQLGGLIGVGWTLAGILLTAMIGVGLIKRQGTAAMMRARAELQEGRPPVAEMLTGACLLLAGAFLLTPGFVTDTLGFLLLIPPLRAVIGLWLLGVITRNGGMVDLQASMGATQSNPDMSGFTAPENGAIIDAEYEEIPADKRP